MRHYAAWKQYVQRPRISNEFTADLPYSQTFLDMNKPLFERLAEDLRLIDSRIAVKFQGVGRDLPVGVRPLCGSWLGCAINEGQDDVVGGKTHRDVNDDPGGFNAVVPFGLFEGADILLWPLEARVEFRRGDVLFFFGSLIAHNTIGVTAGVRNSLDLFSHKSIFDWSKAVRRGDKRRDA